MPQSAVSEQVLHRTFSDFDEMCETVRHWNLEFRQIERGRFQAEILQFGTESSLIAEASFNRRLHQRGISPPGFQTIAIPASPQVEINWRGYQVKGNDLMIFPEGGELDSVSDEHFHVFTCSFQTDLFSEFCRQHGRLGLDELQQGRDVIRCVSQSMNELRQLLHRIARNVRSDVTHLDNPVWRNLIDEEVPRKILQMLAESGGESVPSINANRQLLVESAMNAISQQAHRAIAVSELVEELGVSQRTLEYAFRDRYGTTVKNFILGYRLYQVRTELRNSDPQQTKVADLANRWGFWHMGQFAADYRSFFGELPSETLASSLISATIV